MTRTYRSRSGTATFSGKKQRLAFGSPYGNPTYPSRSKARYCYDYHGRPVSPSPLTCAQPKTVCRVNGIWEAGYAWKTVGYGYEYTDVPLEYWTPPTLDTSPIPAPDGWYLDTVARTNPSRPILCPPTLIQDFVDLPKMLRNLGNLMKRPQDVLTPKGMANGYLETLFGWMPFVDDIKKLLDLQSLISKRSSELHRLYSSEGLRRRLSLGDTHTVESIAYTVDSYGTSKWVVPFSVQVDKRAWSTIRWKPTTLPPYHPDDSKWNNLSRKLVLGMTSEGLAKGLWDVIPWTWLIGWFTNVGQYLLAYSNTVPASHTEACFMSEVTVIARPGPPIPTNCHSLSAVVTGQSVYTYKTRIVSGALTPGFHVPFIDTSRLSILSALTIQRVKR